MGTHYLYRFDAAGQVHSGSAEVWRPAASMSLDGVETSTWLGPFGPCERDLLRVTAAVLEADRLSPRHPQCRRLERDLAWQRSMSLRIAVECPERWIGAIPLLTELLSFMTDDAWEFEFDGMVGRPTEQQMLPFECSDEVNEIALFSGGLDSVAGLFARSACHGGNILAVSAYGNEVRRNSQQTALDALRAHGVGLHWLKLEYQLRDAHRPRNQMEPSQRSRGLFFLAIGATSASKLQMPAFSVYETGVGCINLPTSSAQVGAQGTRSMHPRTLSLFGELLDLAIDRHVRPLAPFFLHTKGELCRLAGRALGDLALVAMSCDEGEGHKSEKMLHCGLCTSCLFRRIALHAGGLVPDLTRYRDIASPRHGRYEMRAFEVHALHLARTSLFAMFQRYSDEILRYFDETRPIAATRAHQPRKEPGRDLFTAAR